MTKNFIRITFIVFFAILSMQFVSADPLTGLTAWYTFDESAGSVFNTWNGSYAANGRGTFGVGQAAPYYNKSVGFANEGTANSGIVLGNVPYSSDFTMILAYYDNETTNNAGALIGQDTNAGSNRAFLTQRTSSTAYTVYMWNSANSLVINGVDVKWKSPVGTKQIIAIRKTASNVSFWQNGSITWVDNTSFTFKDLSSNVNWMLFNRNASDFPYGGVADEFGYWTRALTDAEMTATMSALNITRPFSTVAVTNITLTAFNYFTNASIQSFCVNITGNYTCTTNGTVTFPTILTNSTQTWTTQFLSNETPGYYSQIYTGVNVSSNVNKSLEPMYLTNKSFYAYDFYTNASLTNFSITDQFGNSSSTTTGLLNASLYHVFNQSLTYNITYSSTQNGGYFNQSYTNVAVSSSVNKSLAQSVITFQAREKITGNLIASANFTTTALTNVTHYMNAATWNVTASKSGYFNTSQDVTIAALSIATVNITNLSNAKLNLTARNNITLMPVTTFTAEIIALSYSNYSWSESISGGSQISLLNGTYQVTVRASGYAPSVKNITVAGSLFTTNSTFDLYAENSIYFTIYNATSLAIVNTTTTLVQIFGPSTVINSTTNGTLFVNNLTPGEYNVTVSASGYETAQYTVTIGNNSFQNLNVYLETTTTNSAVFTTLDDDTSQPIQNVLTTIEKRVNGTYYLVNSLYTDITGRFEIAYTTGDVYRFTMSHSDYVTKQFELNPIIFTSYNVRLTRGESASLDVDFAGVSISITPTAYYNNAINNFTFTMGSPLGQLQLINYTIVVSNNVTTLQNSSTNAFGGSLTSRVAIYNATTADTVTLYYNYVDNEGVHHSFTTIYSIQASDTNSTRFNNMGNDQFGLPLFDRVVILFLVTAIIAGAGFLIEGPTTAGFLAIIVLCYFGSTSFVSWWLIIPSIVILIMLGIWRLR